MSVLGEQVKKRFYWPTMYIMIGNIGAGKSTYIKSFLPTAAIVSKDGLRYSLGGGEYIFDPKLEPFIHNTSVHMAEEYCKNKIQKVIIDETNVQRKGRKTFINIARKYNYEATAIVFPFIEKDISVDRRMTNPHCQSDRTIWEGVWDRFNNKYQEPTLEEGFDRIIQVKLEDIV